MQKQVACAKRRILVEPPQLTSKGTRGGLAMASKVTGWSDQGSPETLAPARDGFASGVGETVCSGAPNDIHRELHG